MFLKSVCSLSLLALSLFSYNAFAGTEVASREAKYAGAGEFVARMHCDGGSELRLFKLDAGIVTDKYVVELNSDGLVFVGSPRNNEGEFGTAITGAVSGTMGTIFAGMQFNGDLNNLDSLSGSYQVQGRSFVTGCVGVAIRG